MARSGIRYEEVQAAAETLLGRGLNPTIQRVRELLGTGSNTTISEHLKHWQQQLAKAPKAILPPTVPEAVATALDDFWKIAVRYAEAAFEEQRAAAAQAVAAAEQARDSALAEGQQARAEVTEARRQWEILQATARELADRLLIEQERRTAAETAIAAAEQRVQAAMATVTQIRAETEARVAQMNTALQQSRSDMEQQRAEAQQRFEAERQRNEAGVVRLMQQIDQTHQEQAAERHAFFAERQDWKNREIAAQEQHETLRQDNLELRTALAATQGRQDALVNEIGQLKTTLQQMEARRLDAVRDAEALRSAWKTALANQQRLQQQLAVRAAAPHDQTPMAKSDGY